MINSKLRGGGSHMRKYSLEIALAISIVALTLQLAWGSITRWWLLPSPGKQGILRLPDDEQIAGLSRDALLYLPDNYHAQKPTPLILFLHGAGQRGSDINSLYRRGLPKFIAKGGSVEAIIVAPQCSLNHCWEPSTLLNFLDATEARFMIETDRVYVVGQSMGGFGTWRLVAHAPERFAAAIPLCGGGNTEWAEKLAQIPIWTFHGAKDKVVAISSTEEMVEAVQSASGNIRFSKLSNLGHSIDQAVYSKTAVLKWLLNQRRKPIRTPVNSP